MSTNDDLRQVLATIHAHIGTADQKAAALLTIAGVLIAFPAPSILVPQSPNSVPFPAAFCAALAAVGFVISICAALTVLFPRTVNRTDTSSLIYFGDIAALKKAAYAEAVERGSEATVRADLVAQIHINACIATRKHRFFKLSVMSLVGGIVLLVVAYGALAWSSAITKPPSAATTTGAPIQTKQP